VSSVVDTVALTGILDGFVLMVVAQTVLERRAWPDTYKARCSRARFGVDDAGSKVRAMADEGGIARRVRLRGPARLAISPTSR